MERFQVQAGTVQETLMLPLYGRVYCEEHFPNTFPNRAAQEAARQVDYDFGKLKSSELNMVTWGLRARMLQDAAREYLKAHPKATVINLGCGLDLSFAEIDNGSCKFINVDLPDVIAAREQIVALREREYDLAADLMDFQWMERIQKAPYSVNAADGVYIISGGVLMYFQTEQMKRFFTALAKAFPGGGICFDGENESGVKKSNKIVQKTGNGTTIDFPIEDSAALFREWGSCFSQVREWPFPDYVKKSREVPFKWKLILQMGMRMGMVKIIDVAFADDGEAARQA